MNRYFGELLAWASENYDLVVLDTLQFSCDRSRNYRCNYAGTTYLLLALN